MSKMTRLPIIEATDDQIRDFAELQQLPDVASAKTRAQLLGMLDAVWQNDFILAAVPEEAGLDETAAALQQTERVVLPTSQLVGGIGLNDPKVRLKIGNTSLPGGKDPVPLGVNGRTLVIQRDMEVDVPYRYYLALLDAKRDEVTQDEKTRELTTSSVTNYPIVMAIVPSPEVIEAWHARVDNALMPA